MYSYFHYKIITKQLAVLDICISLAHHLTKDICSSASGQTDSSLRFLLQNSRSTKQGRNLMHSPSLTSNSLVASNSNGGTCASSGNNTIGISQTISISKIGISSKEGRVSISLSNHVISSSTCGQTDATFGFLLQHSRGTKEAGNLMHSTTLTSYSLVASNSYRDRASGDNSMMHQGVVIAQSKTISKQRSGFTAGQSSKNQC